MSSTSHGVSESKASEWLRLTVGTREAKATRRKAARAVESHAAPDWEQSCLQQWSHSEEIWEPGAGGWRPGGTEKARTSQG